MNEESRIIKNQELSTFLTSYNEKVNYSQLKLKLFVAISLIRDISLYDEDEVEDTTKEVRKALTEFEVLLNSNTFDHCEKSKKLIEDYSQFVKEDIWTNDSFVINNTFAAYLASPLFCEKDNNELALLESELSSNKISFFSPRLDSQLDMSSAKTLDERNEMAQHIFMMNIIAIEHSTLVLANTYGTRHHNAIYADAGTMVEVGYAFGADVPVYTYNFDNFGLNIMLSQKVVGHSSDLSIDNPSSILPILGVAKVLRQGYKSYLNDNNEFFHHPKDSSKYWRKQLFNAVIEELV